MNEIWFKCEKTREVSRLYILALSNRTDNVKNTNFICIRDVYFCLRLCLTIVSLAKLLIHWTVNAQTYTHSLSRTSFAQGTSMSTLLHCLRSPIFTLHIQQWIIALLNLFVYIFVVCLFSMASRCRRVMDLLCGVRTRRLMQFITYNVAISWPADHHKKT